MHNLHPFRYFLTPTDSAVIYGVRCCCDVLDIPEELDGHRVSAARIHLSSKTAGLQALRTHGSLRLDLQMNMHLADIDLSEETILVSPPNGANHTQWFRQQPPGAVYLQNYYLGWKNPSKESTLILKDGTLGVAKMADMNYTWDTILFPPTIKYIGNCAFLQADRVVFPADISDRLRLAFPLQFFPCYYNSQPAFGPDYFHLVSHSRIPLEKLTGKQLYFLANSPAIRKRISWHWLPGIPRVDYIEGQWYATADYLSEYNFRHGYTITYRIPSGIPVKTEIFTRRRWPPAFQGTWSEDFCPAPLLWGEAYLDWTVKLIRGGEPSPETLAMNHTWWQNLQLGRSYPYAFHR